MRAGPRSAIAVACLLAALLVGGGPVGSRAAAQGVGAVVGSGAAAQGAGAARPSGPNQIAATCAGRWAPIQAKVSGFVVGNCRGGAAVLGIATDECAPGCVRGGPKEGRGWQAVSLPASAHFAGCGWVNMSNRLRPGAAPPPDRCARRDGPDFAFNASFIRRATTTPPGWPAPRTDKYRGLYLWAGKFTSGAHRGQEGGAIAYRPRLDAPARSCTAYANVNPWLPGQQVRRSERMWTAHDHSAHLQIRYVGRYRARDEAGHLHWWVNAHSTAKEDRDRPWGFVAADCLFGGRAAAGSASAAQSDARPASGVRARAARARQAAAVDQRAFPEKCGFSAVAFHTVTRLHGLSCLAARATLRRLRALSGSHVLLPIACTQPRRLGGWRLTAVIRDPSMTVTHYARPGRPGRSFDLERHQFPGAVVCPAPR